MKKILIAVSIILGLVLLILVGNIVVQNHTSVPSPQKTQSSSREPKSKIINGKKVQCNPNAYYGVSSATLNPSCSPYDKNCTVDLCR